MLDGTLRDDQVGVLEGLWRDILCRRLAEGAAGPVRSPAIAGTRIDASVARKPAEALVVEIEIAAIATADLEQVQRAQHSAKGFPVKRSEEHTSELQSLMRISYAVFCLKKKNKQHTNTRHKKNKKEER